MKAVTIQKFESQDGKLFDTLEACQTHERRLVDIDRIMAPLGPEADDSGCDFGNGGGYIPHDPKVVQQVQDALLAYCKKELKIKDDISFYWLGRILDDNNCSELRSAQYRISACDTQGREWGQIYYAINPGKGKDIVWTKLKK